MTTGYINPAKILSAPTCGEKYGLPKCKTNWVGVGVGVGAFVVVVVLIVVCVKCCKKSPNKSSVAVEMTHQSIPDHSTIVSGTDLSHADFNSKFQKASGHKVQPTHGPDQAAVPFPMNDQMFGQTAMH